MHRESVQQPHIGVKISIIAGVLDKMGLERSSPSTGGNVNIPLFLNDTNRTRGTIYGLQCK